VNFIGIIHYIAQHFDPKKEALLKRSSEPNKH
jgi:hypothetical protein